MRFYGRTGVECVKSVVVLYKLPFPVHVEYSDVSPMYEAGGSAAFLSFHLN